MTDAHSFSGWLERLREFIRTQAVAPVSSIREAEFNRLAGDLFAWQFQQVTIYRSLCLARKVTPENLDDWRQIPAMPTSAFKDYELTSLPATERASVFFSSGTTEQRRSRHFHSRESLAVYEASLLPWFHRHLVSDLERPDLILLTPSPALAPNSSLVHMFETVRREFGSAESRFFGEIAADGGWQLRLRETVETVRQLSGKQRPLVILGTAFSFVHWLDHLAGQNVRLALPAGSRALETGGYKGRSRTLPKAELHALITRHLGILQHNIICEYGMSELSSQAYDGAAGRSANESRADARVFQFPPWARAQIISPETGREVKEGETGLIRILDLANVRSVAAIQTEDLGVKRNDGFELAGRAAQTEARGCSLMTT